MLANVYLGLGEGALEEAPRFTQTRVPPLGDLGCRARRRRSVRPAPLRRALAGLAGARALADAAGAALDEAWSRGDGLTAGATRRLGGGHRRRQGARATRAGLDVANRLFEVTGARATTARHGLDRFWRNLRTHTLHDPVDYKLRELGAMGPPRRAADPELLLLREGLGMNQSRVEDAIAAMPSARWSSSSTLRSAKMRVT